MLHMALVFLVIGFIAALLGFTTIAGASIAIAKFLAGLFLVLFLVFLIAGLAAPGGSSAEQFGKMGKSQSEISPFFCRSSHRDPVVLASALSSQPAPPSLTMLAPDGRRPLPLVAGQRSGVRRPRRSGRRPSS